MVLSHFVFLFLQTLRCVVLVGRSFNLTATSTLHTVGPGTLQRGNVGYTEPTWPASCRMRSKFLSIVSLCCFDEVSKMFLILSVDSIRNYGSRESVKKSFGVQILKMHIINETVFGRASSTTLLFVVNHSSRLLLVGRSKTKSDHIFENTVEMAT